MEYNKEKIKSIGEIKRTARQSLSGKWGMAILVCFIFTIITSGVSAVVSITSIGDTISSFNYLQTQDVVGMNTSNGQVVSNLSALVNFIIGGPLLFGLSTFFLNLIRDNNSKIEDLFSGFAKFGKTFLLNLLILIFSILWAFAVFVPTSIIIGIISVPAIMNLSKQNFTGNELQDFESILPMIVGSIAIGVVIFIVASIIYGIIVYKYELAFYISIDNEDYDAMECISQSKKMMKGFKIKLFLLYLSFIGWSILSLMTICIGFLWLTPYIHTSKVAFYENLKEAYYGDEMENNELVIE